MGAMDGLVERPDLVRPVRRRRERGAARQRQQDARHRSGRRNPSQATKSTPIANTK